MDNVKQIEVGITNDHVAPAIAQTDDRLRCKVAIDRVAKRSTLHTFLKNLFKQLPVSASQGFQFLPLFLGKYSRSSLYTFNASFLSR